jgi:hypothetical protein
VYGWEDGDPIAVTHLTFAGGYQNYQIVHVTVHGITYDRAQFYRFTSFHKNAHSWAWTAVDTRDGHHARGSFFEANGGFHYTEEHLGCGSGCNGCGCAQAYPRPIHYEAVCTPVNGGGPAAYEELIK